jgi:hypothetical protein
MKSNEPGLNYFHLLSSLLGQVKNFFFWDAPLSSYQNQALPQKVSAHQNLIIWKEEKKKKKSLEVVSNNLMPRKNWCNLFFPPLPNTEIGHQFQNYIKINNK